MFIGVLREDEDGIEIPPYKKNQVVLKSVIDNTLERRCCIAEAKRHNNTFEGPKLRVRGSFFDILVVDSNLVEATDKVGF